MASGLKNFWRIVNMSKEWRKIYDDAVAKIQKKNAIRKSKNIHRIYKKLYKKITKMIRRGESWESVTIKWAKPIAQETLVSISETLSFDLQGFKFILEGFDYDRWDWDHHQVSGIVEIWTDEEFNPTPQDI